MVGFWQWMEMCSIYALYDRNNIRYIGQARNPEKRFKDHLQQRKGIVGEWLNEMKLADKKPTMSVLEVCECHRANEREKYWIEKKACYGLKNVVHNKFRNPEYVYQLVIDEKNKWQHLHHNNLKRIGELHNEIKTLKEQIAILNSQK
jgi:predicted GIY-YIG superfamily endonuclease